MAKAQQTTTSARDLRRTVAGAAVILILTLIAYMPAVRSGYIWDDDDYVTNNMTLRSAQGLADIWLKPSATPQYYPLVHTTFWIEYHLWKLSPIGFHVDNVLFHALGAILLWMILRRLSVPGAWLAAAIFALHPVHVESVAWITERKNVLSGVFYLSSALTFLSFAGIGKTDSGRKCAYALSLLLFVCALLSKSVTASLPVALALVLWWKRDRLTPSDVTHLIPYLIIGGAAGFVTSWLEKNRVGAFGSEWDLTFADRLLVAGRALWFYAGKLVWPAKLAFFYPRWEIDSGSAVQWLYPISALILIGALWFLRRRIGKSPFVAAALFGVTLIPALGFVNVYPMRYSWVADHFQYLASIGIIALATSALMVGLDRLERARGILSIVLPALVLASLGTLTWRQTGDYKDAETLWRHTIAKNPSSWAAHNNLAMILDDRADYAEAADEARKAIELNPTNAEAHDNLGVALGGLGQLDEAIAEHHVAIELAPEFKAPYANLAVQLARQGRLDEAREQCETALRLDAGYFAAHNTLGSILMELDKPDEAAREFGSALEIRPDSTDALYNLALAQISLGRLDEAIQGLRTVLSAQPDAADAHGNLAKALYLRGEYADAWTEVHLALKCGGEMPDWVPDLAKKMPDTGE